MTADHVLWGINNSAITHDYLNRAVDSVGAVKGLPRTELLRRLRPLERQIVVETFRCSKAIGDSIGAPVFWVYLPTPMQSPPRSVNARSSRSRGRTVSPSSTSLCRQRRILARCWPTGTVTPTPRATG